MVEILVIIINIIPCKGALKWIMNINTNIINPIVGEDEIMTRNILNVIRGIKIEKKCIIYTHFSRICRSPDSGEGEDVLHKQREHSLQHAARSEYRGQIYQSPNPRLIYFTDQSRARTSITTPSNWPSSSRGNPY